jgi:hypothetical protein
MALGKSWVGFLRGLARVVGFSASAFFLLFAVGEGAGELSRGGFTVLPFTLALLVATAGLILAFRRERLGSLVTLMGSGLLAVSVVWLAESDVLVLELLFAGPFVFAGLLLLWCSHETR